jgi:hypothetical protein
MLNNNKGVFMIKKAFKQKWHTISSLFGWIAIIAIVAVIGLSMVGCGDDDGGNPVDPDGNKVIITEIPANLLVSGSTQYLEVSDLNENVVAASDGTVSGNSVIFDTYIPYLQSGTYPYPPWTGRGSYYLRITLFINAYYYENGTGTAQTYNFSLATSTIPFSKFARLY